MIRWIHNLIRSVFTRLMLVILAAGLLINLVVFLSFGHFRHRYATTYHRILTHYVETLATAIGDPPSPRRAAEVAEATGLVISYRAAESWSTTHPAESLPPLDSYRIRPVSDRTAIGFFRGHMLIRHALAEGELFFAVPGSEAVERALRRWTIFILTALTAVLAGAYLIIRRILEPLRRMKHGVEAVHAGHLDHRVPHRGAAEFKALAAAFNAMTVRVHDMLQSKERLLLDVSHELRSPIARMKLSLAMMPENTRTDALREDLREMEAMVNAILEAARLQHAADALKKSPHDLRALVTEAIKPLQARPPGVRIAASPEVRINADAEKMRTVIRNIVDNGIKYSRPESAPVTVSWETDGERLTVTVQDHGIGIPAEDMARIFEPFFRVDDSRSRTTGGFGLGLSLTKAIVEAHGGSIRISSARQSGTRVEIVLPMA